jgi:hypothetical protein
MGKTRREEATTGTQLQLRIASLEGCRSTVATGLKYVSSIKVTNGPSRSIWISPTEGRYGSKWFN